MPSVNRRISVRLVKMQVCSLVLLSAVTVLLSGCGNFFTCEGKASCPATCTTGTSCTGTGSSTDDYAYVANSATGSTYVDGYNLGSGTLTAATNAPFSFDYSPTSMVVTPAATFLYAASDASLNTTNPGDGYIYGYSIGTGGALSILGGGNPQIAENDAALAVSPDGQWLFTLPDAALLINEYPINTSAGTLGTLENDYALSSASTGTSTPLAVAVAPSGEYIAAALGTGGANVFSFDTTTGASVSGQTPVGINPGSAALGIYAVAFDGNNYLYCAGTAGLQVFSVSPGVTVTLLQTYALGNAPRSIVINSDSTYVYVGNEADSTISAYSIGSGGALTAVFGSPFPGPTSVNALAIDSTGKYLIASGYNSSTGIQLFSIGSTGVLTLNGSAGTGTSNAIPGAIAATR